MGVIRLLSIFICSVLFSLPGFSSDEKVILLSTPGSGSHLLSCSFTTPRKVRQADMTALKNIDRARHKPFHGFSSEAGPNLTYYTEGKDESLLKYIDQVLEEKEPQIWLKYLSRFKTE